MATTVAGLGLKVEVYQIGDSFPFRKKNSVGGWRLRNLADKLLKGNEMAHQAIFLCASAFFFRAVGEAEAKSIYRRICGRRETSKAE